MLHADAYRIVSNAHVQWLTRKDQTKDLFFGKYMIENGIIEDNPELEKAKDNSLAFDTAMKILEKEKENEG